VSRPATTTIVIRVEIETSTIKLAGNPAHTKSYAPISAISRRAQDKQRVNITAQIESRRQRYFPIFPL